jgi:hypothetical protein
MIGLENTVPPTGYLRYELAFSFTVAITAYLQGQRRQLTIACTVLCMLSALSFADSPAPERTYTKLTENGRLVCRFRHTVIGRCPSCPARPVGDLVGI